MILINLNDCFQETSVVEQELRVLGVWILGEQIQTKRNRTQQDQVTWEKRVGLRSDHGFFKLIITRRDTHY